MKKSLVLSVGALMLAACISIIGCKNSAAPARGGAEGSSLPNIGDLILKDGRVIAAGSVTADHADDAMAIVYYRNEEANRVMAMGVDIGMNIKWSDNGLLAGFDKRNATIEAAWKEKLAIQYSTKGLQGIEKDLYDVWFDFGNAFEQTNEAAGASNDWGTPGKYPAFDYARNYGTDNNLDNYKTGWFLPTAMSLYEVGKNKDAINAVLATLSKQQLTEQTKCWSSATNTGAPGRNYGVTLDINKIGGLINFTQNSGNDFLKSSEQAVAAVRIFQY